MTLQATKPRSLNPSEKGVMLVGHGTRDEIGTKQFFQLGSQLAQILSPTPVIPCLLEFQQPTIPEAWDMLIGQGVRHVHVAPLLLFAAGHARRDIPELIAECHSKTPQISFDQSGPLSRNEHIVKLLGRRIDEASSGFDPDRTALVMVGRGSHDPCAKADMRVLTKVVARRLSFAQVATAFYAMAEPKLPDVLDQVALIDGIDNVIVQPHLLFEGRLFQAIERHVREAAERSRPVQFATAKYLGPETAVARAIAARLPNAVGCEGSRP